MKPILFVLTFLIFSTNLNASEIYKYKSLNSPNMSEQEILQKINMSKVKKYRYYHIPFQQNPNLATLQYYFYRDLYKNNHSRKSVYSVGPSQTPYEFKFETIENKVEKKPLKPTGILSYLYFEGDKIIIDEVSPNNRLGSLFDDQTKFRSNSMGKSLAGYILGHAICEGYIDSIDTRINDWNKIKNTLYHDQKLIDLLNMASGDQKFAYSSQFIKKGEFNADGRNNSILDDYDVELLAMNYFRNTKPSKNIYNYSVMNTKIIMNYILYKIGGVQFQNLLNLAFKDKAKIKDGVYFYATDGKKSNGIESMFYATRFDYLRIAKSIMDEYQNDTCFGNYLRDIYERRIPKSLNHRGPRGEPYFNRTKSYGGQFHLDYPGLEDKVVFGMGGYGGKAILIDVEDSRIVVVNTIHYNYDKFKYDHHKLLINPIKHGKKSFK
jgi:CubicO group peptidase (beta-lactamase class C family)